MDDFSSFAFTDKRFILCEGIDDKLFLQRLIIERGLPSFQVCHAAECNKANVGGKNGFKHSLSGFEVISGFSDVRSFLIVTDNDDPSRSFRDVQDIISKNGYTPPLSVGEIGSISNKPLAVLMVPNHVAAGDFEVLCLPEIHRVWPTAEGCVNDFLTCSGAAQWPKQSSLHKARARAATVAFYQDDPFKGIGYLFNNGTLSTMNPCFDEIARFLQAFDRFCGFT